MNTDLLVRCCARAKEKETLFLNRVMSELKVGGVLCVVVWRSKKIEAVLDSILTDNSHWKQLADRYIRYPEKDMDMRMLVLEKVE